MRDIIGANGPGRKSELPLRHARGSPYSARPMDCARAPSYLGLMSITLGQIAEREGSTWALDVHNQMVRNREPLPASFPRTVVAARGIAADNCGQSLDEKLAEMILGHARRTWTDILRDRVREFHP
jgi:hypothetical protein